MKYLELTIHTTSEASELVSDVLWEYAEGGVAVSDLKDVQNLTKDPQVFWDYIDDKLLNSESEVLIKCFLKPSEREKISSIRKELLKRKARGEGISFGTLEETVKEIEGDDWIEIWKKHFRPIPVGKKILILPEWIKPNEGEERKIVSLDSNMAFGTGEHETTRMCLEFLEEYLKEGDEVFDVGCGSGILGIAAKKLGAKFCYLTDIDPVAIESAAHNALKNGVSSGMEIRRENLLGKNEKRADLILANITAEALCSLCPSIQTSLKAGGILILSGIISERLSSVKEAYSGLTLLKERKEGDWISLVYQN